MSSTSTPQQDSPRRPWLEPRSLGHSVLLFTGGYIVAQPILVWVLSRVSGDPLPFTTGAQWRSFLSVVALLGAVAGAVWWMTTLARPGRIELILRSFCRMLALSAWLNARRLAELGGGAWIGMIVLTAAAMALVLYPMERWEAGRAARPRNGRARQVS